MRAVFTALYSAFLTIGKARAASYLARQGDYEGAKALMMEEHGVRAIH
jgi:hypothetical protein